MASGSCYFWAEERKYQTTNELMYCKIILVSVTIYNAFISSLLTCISLYTKYQISFTGVIALKSAAKNLLYNYKSFTNFSPFQASALCAVLNADKSFFAMVIARWGLVSASGTLRQIGLMPAACGDAYCGVFQDWSKASFNDRWDIGREKTYKVHFKENRGGVDEGHVWY